METRNCTVRGVITAARWKETTLVTTGCIWKRKPIPKSRYETHVSSSSYSYHDAVQRAANPSHLPPLHSCIVEGLNVSIVLRHPRLCAEKLNNYWRLLLLIFIFTVYKRTLFNLLIFIDLSKYQLVHILLIFNNISYITLLNMFRAARCCSPLSTCILYGCLQRMTIPEAVVIQLVLLTMSSVLLETCWGA